MTDDILALFDLDHTLLPHDSDEQWVEFLLKRGKLDRIAYERYESAVFPTPESVEREIQKSLKVGWSVNFGVYADGLAGIGVPFPFRNRRNAIVVGAPISRVEKRTDELGKLLRDAVDRFLKENEP